MAKGFFITGTDTGVGKTVISSALAAVLNSETSSVVVYKPIQTGIFEKTQGGFAEDIVFVKYFANLSCSFAEMNTYTLPAPFSPHLAAELAGMRINVSDILSHYKTLQKKYQWILVEGAGGLGVPINRNGFLMADLVKEMNLPLIIVTRVSVGTINHTLLTVKFARSFGLEIKGLIFNQMPKKIGPPERDNPNIISKLTGLPVLGIFPKINGLKEGKVNAAMFNRIVSQVFKGINWFEN